MFAWESAMLWSSVWEGQQREQRRQQQVSSALSTWGGLWSLKRCEYDSHGYGLHKWRFVSVCACAIEGWQVTGTNLTKGLCLLTTLPQLFVDSCFFFWTFFRLCIFLVHLQLDNNWICMSTRARAGEAQFLCRWEGPSRDTRDRQTWHWGGECQSFYPRRVAKNDCGVRGGPRQHRGCNSSAARCRRVGARGAGVRWACDH